MELALGALSSVGSGVASIGSTIGGALGLTGAPMALSGATLAGGAGAAATGAAATGGLGSLLGGVLQGGAGLVQAMSLSRAGQAKADALDMQAATSDATAMQQTTVGINQTNGLKAKLLSTLGQRDVAYGASGIDLSFGTPAAARTQAEQAGADAIAGTADNAEMMKTRLLAQGDSLRQQAAEAQDAGDIGADGALLSAGARILSRG